ncbi:MAG: gfo/Idh/MocA family oxidoreductase [Crocinitomicaceae bacterium TMED114]|nr:MAG: gfo/Idh/MocA family oxidoreductase [Crocinitomicaceae bacterium TMED114]
MSAPLRIGLFGTGHLGRIHLRCLRLLQDRWELVGCCDPSPASQEAVATLAESEGWEAVPTWFDSPEALIDAVDAIAIVTPTSEHARLAKLAIEAGKGCFIEKPITTTLKEAEDLLDLQNRYGSVVQIGHVERFNPAFQAARHHLDRPRFIEAHRLAPFNPRGLDVPVVLDLMIHDIDLALHALEGDVVRVAANGVAVVGSSVDIANARIEFSSGAVANLTASRVSLSPMRKVRLFQPDAYLSVDLLNRSAQVVRLETLEGDAERDPYGLYFDVPGQASRQLHIDTPDIGEANAIADELSNFHAACSGTASPQVPLQDGLAALRVAQQVMDCIALTTP